MNNQEILWQVTRNGRVVSDPMTLEAAESIAEEENEKLILGSCEFSVRSNLPVDPQQRRQEPLWQVKYEGQVITDPMSFDAAIAIAEDENADAIAHGCEPLALVVPVDSEQRYQKLNQLMGEAMVGKCAPPPAPAPISKAKRFRREVAFALQVILLVGSLSAVAGFGFTAGSTVWYRLQRSEAMGSTVWSHHA